MPRGYGCLICIVTALFSLSIIAYFIGRFL